MKERVAIEAQHEEEEEEGEEEEEEERRCVKLKFV